METAQIEMQRRKKERRNKLLKNYGIISKDVKYE